MLVALNNLAQLNCFYRRVQRLLFPLLQEGPSLFHGIQMWAKWEPVCFLDIDVVEVGKI